MIYGRDLSNLTSLSTITSGLDKAVSSIFGSSSVSLRWKNYTRFPSVTPGVLMIPLGSHVHEYRVYYTSTIPYDARVCVSQPCMQQVGCWNSGIQGFRTKPRTLNSKALKWLAAAHAPRHITWIENPESSSPNVACSSSWLMNDGCSRRRARELLSHRPAYGPLRW